MQCTKNEPNLQKTWQELLKNYPQVMPIVHKIDKKGGKTMLVGGAVRDLFLGVSVKDLDIEVYGLQPHELEKILRTFGPVSTVGKAFGVFRVHGLDIDWSLPRSDSAGRKPDVVVDPDMNFQDAFGRRDLTMNAMGIDLLTAELIDPYHGQQDIGAKILRAPKIKLFQEDPLRFFRVMQFIGRFDMYPDAELNDVCRSMSLQGISLERIEEEFEKLFLKSLFPSRGLRWLRTIGRLQEILPELAAMIGVPQDPKWHPEGDVFEHALQSLDAAAQLSYTNNEEKLIIMMAALCHDIGKITTTQIISKGIISYGHAEQGAKSCISLLKRMTRKNYILESVPKLVRYHMLPKQFVVSGAKASAYKRLAHNLAPQTNIVMLIRLALADARGRAAMGHIPTQIDVPELSEFLARAQQAEVHEQIEKPILHGSDIMDIVAPGPQMGNLLKQAYEIQLEEGVKDKDVLKERMRKLSKNGPPR